MTTVFGIRVAVNGSETDSVTGDDWVEKISRILIKGGGGNWISPGSPFVCDFDLDVPADRAHSIRTITVAVEGPSPEWQAHGGAPAYATETSTGSLNYYRVIFHGDITQVKGKVGDGLTSFSAVDELQGWLTRRRGTGTAGYGDPDHGIGTGTGSPAVLPEADTDIGIGATGANHFPYYNMDPGADSFPALAIGTAASEQTFGALIDKALAGTGVNFYCDWNGPITAPVMRYRPDWFYHPDTGGYLSTLRRQQPLIRRPWLAVYEDFGLDFADFPARIHVTGDTYWGWARLSSGAVRTSLGRRQVKISTYQQSGQNCRRAANRLLGKLGNPEWLRQKRTTFPIEYFYANHADLIAAESTTGYPVSTDLWHTACIMLGDELQTRADFDGSTDSDPWPATVSTATYNELEALWQPTITNSGDSELCTRQVVKGLDREWIPNGGWKLSVDLWPDPDDPIVSDSADTDYGPQF